MLHTLTFLLIAGEQINDLYHLRREFHVKTCEFKQFKRRPQHFKLYFKLEANVKYIF